jgi:hypothetical protein
MVRPYFAVMQLFAFASSLFFCSTTIADPSEPGLYNGVHHHAHTLVPRQVENATSAIDFTTTVLTGRYVEHRTYTQPYINIDEWRNEPICHRYMHGGFRGTELRFSYYFPPKEQYKGRFFQGLPAVAGREDVVFQPVTLGAVIADIAPFSFETGGYTVESNQGSEGMISVLDPTINGYRGSSAAAQLSREVAQKLYNDARRPYGYVFGGSGGGYKTLACIEAGKAWDGAAPFIIGSPVSIPNVFTVQAHAMRVLGRDFPKSLTISNLAAVVTSMMDLTRRRRTHLQRSQSSAFRRKHGFELKGLLWGTQVCLQAWSI